MGMDVGHDGSGGAKREINVTPLVDVVLVLLVIFLVTIPIQTRQISVEIPRTAGPDVFPAANQITLATHADGSMTMRVGGSEETFHEPELLKKLRPAVKNLNGEKTVFVDFETEVKYKNAVQVMDLVAGAAEGGAEKVKVALVDKSAKR